MLTPSQRNTLIQQINDLPAQLAELVSPLDTVQLTTPFLAGEWTVAQNVHHLADSHMNSYIRCKLIACEDHPTLRPYNQDDWAALPDAQAADISSSLTLLNSLHARWVAFFRRLADQDWVRTGFHPENGVVTLETQLQAYAAHGLGHLEQIRHTLAAQSA